RDDAHVHVGRRVLRARRDRDVAHVRDRRRIHGRRRGPEARAVTGEACTRGEPTGYAGRRRHAPATVVAVALALIVLAGCPKFHAGPLPGAPADATFVEVGGVRVRYRDQGAGPAVVMIHGFGG